MNTKQELIETIKRLLVAEDVDLDFLNKLEENELKTLIVSISDRLEKQKQWTKTEDSHWWHSKGAIRIYTQTHKEWLCFLWWEGEGV